MQALRKVVQAAVPGTRSMAGAGAQTCEARWAKYFPQPPVSQAQAQKSVRKEMIGFLLLGPASALAMVYDLVFGLEHHEPHPIPPYPWMRHRLLPGMPWGEDGLFEYNPLVATEWPPAEGLPAKH